MPLGCFGNGFVVQYEGIPILPPVAQLDRVSDFESEGRRFESHWRAIPNPMTIRFWGFTHLPPGAQTSLIAVRTHIQQKGKLVLLLSLPKRILFVFLLSCSW